MSNQQFPPPQSALHEGMRVYLPGPAPVSVPGAALPPGAPVGNMGQQYGIQRSASWAAGDSKPIQIVDVLKADALWRLSVLGPVYVSLLYGTSKATELVDLQAPVVITVPGQLQATVRPIDSSVATKALVTLTQATAGAFSQARKFVQKIGPNVALDDRAVRFFALANSTLTISGVVVVVPALSVVPLVAGSVLTGGSGFQEFEA